MCNNFPTIKVVEKNDFSLIFPLKRRTYRCSKPIDEDIDATQLTNVVVKVGGVEYTPSLGEDGVRIEIPKSLRCGSYDLELTAEYHGSDIRVAYEAGLTIVEWNSMSDAEQYVQGSPVMVEAAYVIGGTLTDAELEALKTEYRLKIAAAERAKEDAEAAKEAYDEKAEALDGIAQQSTLTQGISDIRDDISHIDIDTSTLAKQGSNPSANISDIQALIGYTISEIDSI